jgi:biotin carboxyl carrier protein
MRASATCTGAALEPWEGKAVIFDAGVLGRTLRVEVRAQAGGVGRYTVSLDGRRLEVDLAASGSAFLSLLLEGKSYEVGLERREGGYNVVLGDRVVAVDLAPAARGSSVAKKPASGPLRLTAPMPGKLVRVLVAAGDVVAAGQGLVVMEAMKMENELRSPRAGRVREIPVREGQVVEAGALLVLVE